MHRSENFLKKQKAYFSAKQRLDELGFEYDRARSVAFGKSCHFDRLIDTEKKILLESYDPIIDDAIEFFHKKLQWLRSDVKVVMYDIQGGLNPVSLEKEVKAVSNRPAILEAIFYCQKSLKKLEKMKLSPSIDDGMGSGSQSRRA